MREHAGPFQLGFDFRQSDDFSYEVGQGDVCPRGPHSIQHVGRVLGIVDDPRIKNVSLQDEEASISNLREFGGRIGASLSTAVAVLSGRCGNNATKVSKVLRSSVMYAFDVERPRGRPVC